VWCCDFIALYVTEIVVIKYYNIDLLLRVINRDIKILIKSRNLGEGFEQNKMGAH